MLNWTATSSDRRPDTIPFQWQTGSRTGRRRRTSARPAQACPYGSAVAKSTCRYDPPDSPPAIARPRISRGSHQHAPRAGAGRGQPGTGTDPARRGGIVHDSRPDPWPVPTDGEHPVGPARCQPLAVEVVRRAGARYRRHADRSARRHRRRRHHVHRPRVGAVRPRPGCRRSAGAGVSHRAVPARQDLLDANVEANPHGPPGRRRQVRASRTCRRATT